MLNDDKKVGEEKGEKRKEKREKRKTESGGDKSENKP